MSSYRERLAAMPSPAPIKYISNEDFRRQKSALTRAKNSGDPMKVLRTVEKTLKEWQGHAWPDDWSMWRRALEDAAWEARQAGDYDTYHELEAASIILFD